MSGIDSVKPVRLEELGFERDVSASPRVEREETPRLVYVSVGLVCFNSFLLGYDIGVMSGAILYIKEHFGFSDTQKEVIVGSLNIVAAFGAVFCGFIADKYGRKVCIKATSVLFVAGALIMTFSWDFGSLLLGRIITGVGIGGGLIISPLYCSEITPAYMRGYLVSFAEIFINFGILFGYVVNVAFYQLDDSINWRIMLAFGVLPAVLILSTLATLPESPRWLVYHGHEDGAIEALNRVHATAEGADRELMNIREAMMEDTVSWREMLQFSGETKFMMITAVGTHLMQQISGTEAVVYYIPEILKDAGLTRKSEELIATMGIGICKFVFILVATFTFDRYGRRPLMMLSAAGMTLSLIMLASAGSSVGFSIFSLCCFMASFSIGFGPGAWVVASEVLPSSIRAKGLSLATFVNRMTSGIIASTFLSFVNAMGVSGTFALYAVFGFLSLLFVYFMVPETKQKTLEEITAFFKRSSMLRRQRI